MAIRAQNLFIVAIVTQLTLLLLFVAVRDPFVWFKTNNPARNVSDDNFLQHLLQHNDNATSLVTASLSGVALTNTSETLQQGRQSTKTEDRATTVKDDGRHQNESADTVRTLGAPTSADLREGMAGNETSGGLPTNGAVQSETFQSIDGEQAWLYSAFFDHVAAQSGRPLVRIFGLARRDCLKMVYCNLTTGAGNLTVTGYITELPDSHGVNYPPSHVECFLPKNTHPTHVSVSFQTKEKPTNRLQILYSGLRIRNFTVCYSVLHSGYNKATQLIENIEMNRILGAEHFMVYNYSIAPEVDQIIRRYQQDGLVTVLQWPIPTLATWYYAQVTALSDCFYRNRNTSRFVVVMDTDELIVPRSSNNWMELIHSAAPHETDVSSFLPPVNQTNTAHTLNGCFMIRSSHFTMDTTPKWDSLPSQYAYTDEEKKNVIKYKMVALSQLIRTETIFQPRIKSKYIARPELVYQAGIHLARKFVYYMRCLNVDENLAIIHHYKKYNLKKGILNDTSILKFKQSLHTRVMEQIGRFPKIFT